MKKWLILCVCCLCFAVQAADATDPNSQNTTSVAPNSATEHSQEVVTSPPSTDKNTRAVTPYSPASLAGQVVTGLLLVLGLIVILAWAAKKFGYANFNGQGQLRMLASLPLGTREKAVLIEVNGKQMLLGVAPGRVNFLQQVEPNGDHEPSETAQFVSAEAMLGKGQDFAGYLKNLLSQGKKSA